MQNPTWAATNTLRLKNKQKPADTMKEKHIDITLMQYTIEELDADMRHLVDMAKEATGRSYSPYSHFSVGAAVLLADGTVVIGANQENAAYPSGLCAERTALFAAGAQYPDMPVVALAIAARNERGLFTPQPVSPCGACRQVMLEVEERYHQPMQVLLYGTEVVNVLKSARDLLPLCFLDADMH